MSNDKIIGGLILTFSMLGIILYGWVVFFTEYAIFALQVTAFIAVGRGFSYTCLDRLYISSDSTSQAG